MLLYYLQFVARFIFSPFFYKLLLLFLDNAILPKRLPATAVTKKN